jgi:ornithine carbamoyltransferase
MTRHLLHDTDLSPAEQATILDAALGPLPQALAGKAVALLFEKPSTRTRLSFEVGVQQLGGQPVVLSADQMQLGRGETLEDTARVLSRYVDAIVLRTGAHDRLERIAAASTVPVVNALTDLSHPCQALADLLTLRKHGRTLTGFTLTYLGDGNNMAHSLLLAGATAGLHVRVATPPAFACDVAIVAAAERLAASTGGSVRTFTDPIAASTDSDALYTDVWVSMGQEDEAAARHQPFLPYALDEEKIAVAAADALVMHCLPAHRGEEISAAAVDGPRSVVFDQAESRLHAQKSLLVWLMDGVNA